MDAAQPSQRPGADDLKPVRPPTFCFLPGPPPPARVSLQTIDEHACPYLPGRSSSSRAFWAQRMPGKLYHRFMDAGFRRSGKVFYQPVCRGCRACQPIRVPVATFAPSKSQRRVFKRNADLTVTRVEPQPTAETFDLYRRYVSQWHDKDASDPEQGWEAYVSFLYDSPVQTVAYQYRDPAGRLLGVGICDLCDDSLSSVYFYHDPGEASRGLGTFGAVFEIEEARRLDIPFYYLGFWIDGCRTMQYKSTFRPNEILHPDGQWRVNAAVGENASAAPQ